MYRRGVARVRMAAHRVWGWLDPRDDRCRLNKRSGWVLGSINCHRVVACRSRRGQDLTGRSRKSGDRTITPLWLGIFVREWRRELLIRGRSQVLLLGMICLPLRPYHMIATAR